MLVAYAKDNGEIPFYRLRRWVDAFRNQKLIRLGYNPHKQVAYNWHEQFKDDPDVMRLLNEPINFNAPE